MINLLIINCRVNCD